MTMKVISLNDEPFFEELQSIFEIYKLKETLLYKNCLQLIDVVHEVSSFAPDYNFANVQANGYLSLVKIVKKFLSLVQGQVRNRKKRPDLTNASSALVKLTNNVLKIRKLDQQETFLFKLDENVNLINAVSTTLCPSKSYQLILDKIEEQELVSIYIVLGTFWLPKSVQNVFELYFLMVCFYCSKIWTRTMCLFSRQVRIRQFVEVITSKDILNNSPIKAWNYCQNKFVVWIQSLFTFKRARVKTVYVPSQSKYLINKDGFSISIDYNNNNQTSDRRIRCRLITNHAEPEILIFHVHGGGYVATKPEGHECYLVKWSDQNPNTVLLSVDYRLAHLYPAAIQDVLDAYLAVTSQSQESVLGFKPQKIILIGESAGGHAILSLTFMLNDMKSLGEDVTIPNAVMPIYPSCFNSFLVSPSCVLKSIDPMICYGTSRVIFHSYFGFRPSK